MNLDEVIAALQALRAKIGHGSGKVEVRGHDGVMKPAKYAEAVDLGRSNLTLTVLIESE